MLPYLTVSSDYLDYLDYLDLTVSTDYGSHPTTMIGTVYYYVRFEGTPKIGLPF